MRVRARLTNKVNRLVLLQAALRRRISSRYFIDFKKYVKERKLDSDFPAVARQTHRLGRVSRFSPVKGGKAKNYRSKPLGKLY
jgi:hypothetical protein